ncbi:MAG: PilZ domain-containing protein [Treponema sp.]|nr:PilZ domain-containing protein [Treponema sp.]
MRDENRVAERFDDMGKIVCPELCALSGSLQNISRTGLKIYFPVPVSVDLEAQNEYEIRITLAKKIGEPPLVLVCVPQWVREVEHATEIGLKALYSPDQSRYMNYISELETEKKDDFFPEII